MNNNTELILIRITGLDRPGLTASITEILSKYDEYDVYGTVTSKSSFRNCLPNKFDNKIYENIYF